MLLSYGTFRAKASVDHPVDARAGLQGTVDAEGLVEVCLKNSRLGPSDSAPTFCGMMNQVCS